VWVAAAAGGGVEEALSRRWGRTEAAIKSNVSIIRKGRLVRFRRDLLSFVHQPLFHFFVLRSPDAGCLPLLMN
jgi:hypothetical protein